MSIDEFEKTNIGQLKAGVQIVATDLSPSMLANCKSGEYDSLAIGRGQGRPSRHRGRPVSLHFQSRHPVEARRVMAHVMMWALSGFLPLRAHA